MNILFTALVVVQVITALIIIGLVLLQHGKGADMGAAFGSGASGSLFGASGSSNFLSKATAIAATFFFCATLALAYFGSHRTSAAGGGGGVMEGVINRPAPVPAPQPSSSAPANKASAPATPATPSTNQIPK